jgi:hypothetical protein
MPPHITEVQRPQSTIKSIDLGIVIPELKASSPGFATLNKRITTDANPVIAARESFLP